LIYHTIIVTSSQEYVVKAVANTSKTWSRSKKEEEQERRRRRRRKAIVDFLWEDPEDELDLSGEPSPVRVNKRAVLATAESLLQTSLFCHRRKATFEEQVATAALSPGCPVCLPPETLPGK
jgi:hypothetical protein